MNDIKNLITVDDIEKLDVRVGTIIDVTDIKESNKLVSLTVDFGDFKRNISVGFKTERENPSEVIGKQALFVVNLAPRKMAGVVSEGMIFDIGFSSGITPVLAIPEKNVPNGTKAG